MLFSQFFTSIDLQTVANPNLIVGFEAIFLVQRLQPNAVFLVDGINTFALLHDMERVFEGFVGAFLLLFQIHDVALAERFTAVTLVIFRKFSVGKPHLVGNRLESVASSRHDIKIFVVNADDVLVGRGNNGLMMLRTGQVILVKLIEFDEVNPLLRRLRIRRIAALFPAVSPTVIVGSRQLKQAFVACRGREKLAMVLVALEC